MWNTRYRWIALAALGAVLSSCGPGNQASLTIIDPVDGSTLTLADDTQPDQPGLQFDVGVQAVGVAVGDVVDLLLLEDDRILDSETVPDSGELTFADVTLQAGRHTLVAATRTTDLRSNTVTIEVIDGCASVSFISPAPGGSRVTLGPADDTDGEACGGSFETTVVVATDAGDGAEAVVFVNGTPRRTARVEGASVRFEGVGFDIGTDNELAVRVTNTDGVTCPMARFGAPITIDCEGVLCQISEPSTSSGFLNQSNDVSGAPGLQTDFEVTTDAAGASQAIRLIIDGNETDALSAMPAMSGTGGVAAFGNVSLSEGVHRVQAECRDAVGNVTRSGTAEWTVDTVPCAIGIDSPTEGTLFIDADDEDPDTSGVQIDASGTAGADCTDLRVDLCSAIEGSAFSSASASWSQRVTLGSSAMQSVCAQSRDAAGNVNTAMVGVSLQTMSPQVEIASPAPGSTFNRTGAGGRTADLNASTPACEALFEVYCTGVGDEVEIVRSSTGSVLAAASCVADATVPAPYTGIARFDTSLPVPLPSVESFSAYNVFARHTVGRLSADSAPISLQADCVSPQLAVVRPTCSAMLLASQDEDTATLGFQYRTNVAFTNGQPGDEVTLTIRPSGGGSATDMRTATFATSPVIFMNASYGSGGVLEIEASAVDAAGNVGTSAACNVTVLDLPSVAITQPTMSAVLDGSADCDTGTPGLQIRVRGTTDAAPGATAAVTVGSGPAVPTTVGSGGLVDVCVDAAEGRSVTVALDVTDSRGTGRATVSVTIDTMPPTDAIGDLAASVVDRRGGVVRFTWTAVADAGGHTLSSYALRCAASAIVTETDWSSATPRTVTRTPGTAGSVQSEDIGGFRVGTTRHCVLRGVDPTGAMTPLPTSSTSVTIDFLTHEVTSAGSLRLGDRIAPIGDVNGDGVDDVLIGGNGSAYLYFGSPSGLPASPAVTITGPSGSGFGRVAGVGDANGDGVPDFVVSANSLGSSFEGAVFLFFGRSSSTPWPSEITVDVVDGSGGVTCGGVSRPISEQRYACFFGDSSVQRLGWSVAPAGDFDGDGLLDIAMGAPGTRDPLDATILVGRAYIILGDSGWAPGSMFTLGVSGGPDGFYLQGEAAAQRQLGNVVASLGGDLDGDGRHDLLIHSAGASTGPMAVVSDLPGRGHAGGGLTNLPLSSLRTIGTGAANTFGVDIAGVGDVNGDGILDVGVFDPAAGASGTAGRVLLYLGQISGFTGSTVITISNDISPVSNNRFGSPVAAGRHPALGVLGDMDRDRVADMLVGSVLEGTDPGRGYLFYRNTSTTGMNRSAADAFLGRATSGAAGAGIRVCYLGDVNGDGASDIALGDPTFSSNAGRIVVHY